MKRTLGFVMFIVALVAWLYLYFGMPFTGIVDVVLQMATWLIGIVGLSMVVAVQSSKKKALDSIVPFNSKTNLNFLN